MEPLPKNKNNFFLNANRRHYFIKKLTNNKYRKIKNIFFIFSFIGVMVFSNGVSANVYNDGDFDGLDLKKFSDAINSTVNSPNYNENLDFAKDGDVDDVDLFQFANTFGRVKIVEPLITKEIGPDGGEVEISIPGTQYDGVKLTIPCNAVDRPVNFSIFEPVYPSNILNEFDLTADDCIFNLGFEPDGMLFNKDVRISIPDTFDSNDILVLSTNEKESSDVHFSSIKSNTIEIQTNHFSTKFWIDKAIFLLKGRYLNTLDWDININADLPLLERHTQLQHKVQEHFSRYCGKWQGMAESVTNNLVIYEEGPGIGNLILESIANHIPAPGQLLVTTDGTYIVQNETGKQHVIVIKTSEAERILNENDANFQVSTIDYEVIARGYLDIPGGNETLTNQIERILPEVLSICESCESKEQTGKMILERYRRFYEYILSIGGGPQLNKLELSRNLGCYQVTIDAKTDCSCFDDSGVVLEGLPSGGYNVLYLSGAVRTNSYTYWNRQYSGTCKGCSYLYYCWSMQSTFGPLPGFGSGYPSMIEAEEQNTGANTDYFLESDKDVFFRYHDNGCSDNSGSISYFVEGLFTQ